ncbi:MAG TPA: chorismate mutase [Vampirovibrionales bacterium]
MNTESKRPKAIRAATTIKQDKAEEIRLATKELISAVMKENDLQSNDVFSILFSLTPDIKSLNPATAVREELNFTDISMLCAQEAFIENGLPFCIRAMFHVYVNENKQVQHIYKNEAKVLRADWLVNNS